MLTDFSIDTLLSAEPDVVVSDTDYAGSPLTQDLKCTSDVMLTQDKMIAKQDSYNADATKRRCCAGGGGGGTTQRKARPKNFQCPSCKIAFSNNGQLKNHVRIHTGERPFACDFPHCTKTFTRNEELTRHKLIHTGIRPHACSACGKRFGRKDHLKKHMRTHERKCRRKRSPHSSLAAVPGVNLLTMSPQHTHIYEHTNTNISNSGNSNNNNNNNNITSPKQTNNNNAISSLDHHNLGNTADAAFVADMRVPPIARASNFIHTMNAYNLCNPFTSNMISQFAAFIAASGRHYHNSSAGTSCNQ